MFNELTMEVLIAGIFLFLLTGSCAVYLVFFHGKKMSSVNLEKRLLLFQLEHKELNMSFQERELVLEEISREVHDNIGQIAFLVRMNLYTIKKESFSPNQTALIDYVSELMDRLIKDTRYIGRSLDADFIKGRGLYSMLENDMEHMNASKKIVCSLEFQGDDHVITAEQQLLVYRIAQQAISNALKHAKAYYLEIQVKYFTDNLLMSIKDDGIGFDEEAIKESGTTGLENMRKRAQILNGDLQIETAPGKGCTIVLSCPIDSLSN